MTIPRLLEMSEYWGNNPPVHELVAAFFGVSGKKPKGVNADEASGAFVRDFLSAGGMITVDPTAKDYV